MAETEFEGVEVQRVSVHSGVEQIGSGTGPNWKLARARLELAMVEADREREIATPPFGSGTDPQWRTMGARGQHRHRARDRDGHCFDLWPLLWSDELFC